MAKLTLKKTQAEHRSAGPRQIKNLARVKEELEKIETLEEKKEYLEKTLKEVKDEKLKKEVEKLLEEIKKLIGEKEPVKDTLEKKFVTEIPAPEPPEAPPEAEFKPPEITPPTAPPPAPPEEKPEEPSLLEKYLRPVPPVTEEKPLEPVIPLEAYRMRLPYMSETSRDTVHDFVAKYLRAEGLKPEELAGSPELQHRAAEKVHELLGGRAELYEIERQVHYEAQKLAHPEISWKEEPGFEKYGIKVVKPELAEA